MDSSVGPADGLVDGHVAGREAIAAGWRVRPGLGRVVLLVLGYRLGVKGLGYQFFFSSFFFEKGGRAR